MIAITIDSISKNEVITPEMSEIKSMIANTFTQRNAIKMEMQRWYDEHPKENFPNMKRLIMIDSTLSELDSSYKRLWDYNNLKII
jgi:hypothetical protein